MSQQADGWYSKMETYLMRSGLSNADAQDIAQDIAIAYIRVRGVEPWSDPLPQTALVRYITNKLLAFYSRTRLRESRAIQRYVSDVVILTTHGLSVETMACKELEIERLMGLLPELVRKAIQWLSEGYTYAEIARMLGVPDSTVKTWVRRARLQLGRQIAGEGCNQNTASGNIIHESNFTEERACDDLSQPRVSKPPRNACTYRTSWGGDHTSTDDAG